MLALRMFARARPSIWRSRWSAATWRVCIRSRSSSSGVGGGALQLPSDLYEARVRAGTWRADAEQRAALREFDALFRALQHYTPRPLRAFDPAAPELAHVDGRGPPVPRGATQRLLGGLKALLGAPHAHVVEGSAAPRGLYVWGGVGCGKTSLMDLLVAALEQSPAASRLGGLRRVHFHQFMLDVHRRMHAARTRGAERDPLPRVAHELARLARLLAFDELHVTDIADAGILRRLFAHLLAHGAVCVFTSNRAPDDLYAGGLNRDTFLPFIALVHARFRVLALQSPRDYRLTGTRLADAYHSPLGPASSAALERVWQRLTDGGTSQALRLPIGDGRELPVPRAAKGVAFLHFDALCRAERGAADFAALARAFPTLLLDGVPRMTLAQRTEARRFITLLDELYEHRVKLVCAADAPPQQLFEGSGQATLDYELIDALQQSPAHHHHHQQPAAIFTGAEERFMFARAASRLVEMQSQEYLAAPHRP